ncbi:MAG: alpha/beta hydrolase [Chloroflexi bacterium]|jgi:N-formylmaleamate deformylase|nr:alpha/beta hydrolase [Chloroflexota bacterium]
MAGWRSADVLANGIRVHYRRTGGDKPPLVLAHGITDSGACWEPVARALEHAYDVIMVDARGHGLTEVPRDGFTWEALGEDLAAFIRALGLDRPSLMGHSMGADTVAQVAAHYPDLVGRAVLEDPPWRDPEATPVDRQASVDRFRTSILDSQRLTREQLIARAREQSPTWPEDELGPWAESKLQVSPRVAEIAGSPREPWRVTAGQIVAPTLLITAEPGKAIVTREGAQEALRLMRRGRELHIPGAGHCIHREQFGLTIAGVEEFLREA